MRKLSLLLILSLSLLKLSSQTMDSLCFEITDFENDKAYLLNYYGDDLYVIDSVVDIDDGVFSFSRSLIEDNGIYRISLGKDPFFGQERYFDFFYDRDEDINIKTDFYDCFYEMQCISYSNKLLYNYYYYEDDFLDSLGASEYSYELLRINFAKYIEYFSKFTQKLNEIKLNAIDKDIIEYIYALMPSNEENYSNFLLNYFENIDISNAMLYSSPIISNKTAQYFDLIYNYTLISNESGLEYMYIENAYNVFHDYDEALSLMLSSLIESIDLVNDNQRFYNFLLQTIKNDSTTNKAYLKRNIYELELRIYMSKGAKAPDFKYKTLDNISYSLENMQKEHNVLVFWSMECDQCTKLLNVLYELASKSEKNGQFTIYAINTDGDLDRWRKYLAENNKDLIVHLIDIEDNITAKEKFYISETPCVIDLNNSGFINEIFDLTDESSNNRFFNIIE